MPTGPARTRRSTTSTAASPTTATGTACSAASTSATCAWRRYEHLIAAEDAADRALGHAARGRDCADLDLDGLPEVLLATTGQVVAVKPGEGGGIGVVGHPGRAARAGRGAPPPARGVPRDAARARGRRGGDASAATARRRDVRRTAAARPPRSTTSSWSRRPASSARLFYDDHERRSGLVRFLAPDTTPEAFATAAATELGDLRDGDVRRRPPRARPGLAVARGHASPASRSRSSKTIRLRGDRLAPELVIDLELHHRGDAPIDARLGPRAVAPPARRRRQPVGLVRRRRRPIGPRRHRRRPRASTRSATATTGSGVAVRGHGRAGRRRLVEPDRDRLELGVRLRARLPGQRLLLSWPLRLAPGRVPPVLGAPGGQRRPRPRGRGGGRRPREPRRPATGR